jgi:hypothetical protein
MQQRIAFLLIDSSAASGNAGCNFQFVFLVATSLEVDPVAKSVR